MSSFASNHLKSSLAAPHQRGSTRNYFMQVIMTCDCRLSEETQPSAPWDSAILQREAITTVVDLVVRHQPNAACLLGLHISCQSIFSVCLPQCGDFGVQVLQEHPANASHKDLLLFPTFNLLPILSGLDRFTLTCRWTSLIFCTDAQSMAVYLTPI